MAGSVSTRFQGHRALTATRRQPLWRVLGLALAVALCTALQERSTAFTALLTRLAGPRLADRRSPAAQTEPEGDAERRNKGARGAESNATLQHDTVLYAPRGSQRTNLSPPWTTCFVEGEVEGRQVLEEWLMRGERKNVAAFQSWRQSTLDGQGSLRCMEAKHKFDDDAVCLECHSHTSSQVTSTGVYTVETVQTQLLDTFVDVHSCFASTVGGSGFCKSGQVTVPR